ncbi:MAG: ABC transporter permease [Spirochaetes bacterium]|nr:ABC transporter permease [Spirochaetota bacterium]
MKKFWAIYKARNKEFFRDRGTLAWFIIFPVLLVFGFYFLFSRGPSNIFKVGLVNQLESSEAFYQYQHIQFIQYTQIEDALEKLRHHQLDLLVDMNTKNYWINKDSANGYLVEKLLTSMPQSSYQKKIVEGKPIRYVDWVVPGILGMNIMFGCLFGVGFVIVRYRKNGVLKRLKATPLTALEFLSAQVLSRLTITLAVSVLVFIGCNFFLKFIIKGSFIDLLIITALGAISMIALGLLFASRLKSEELAGGLINVVTWPMMLLSGVWFSLEGTPQVIQKVSLIFPLTHFITGARTIMLDGASLIEVAPNVLVLVLTSLLFIILASLIFKWD